MGSSAMSWNGAGAIRAINEAEGEGVPARAAPPVSGAKRRVMGPLSSPSRRLIGMTLTLDPVAGSLIISKDNTPCRPA